MSLNKLKLNPDKTEFIVFGTKGQRNNLSKHFPVHILGESPQPLQFETMVCGLILISLCLNMCSAYVGAVLCQCHCQQLFRLL